MWFGTREAARRDNNQRAVITAVISIGLASLIVLICNHYYFRVRPFNELPAGSVHLLFYRPRDSSFPANLAAVVFAIAVPVFVKNKGYGAVLLAIAILSSIGRIYIGIHYPLDILGGAAIGTLAAFLAFGVVRLGSPLIDFFMNLLRRVSLA